MKSIIQIGGVCVVVLVFCCLDFSGAATGTYTTSPGTTTSEENPKNVYVSNLTYSAVRKIRVGTTTASSSTRSSKSKSNRKLNAKKAQAKKVQAKRSQAKRSSNRKTNARLVRG
ncbi:uncharacterized protein [Drosophila takahashii]|uniref:uncharacterized protein n=1 Tax=Drosophila takahashii TaxID=29030 RepID=UPI001CF84A1C|nr:uncharacterized protein LOC108063117 [Drosophila takahashii]